MKCTQCAAVSFSAAARTLVERDYRCPQCGGELMLVAERPRVTVPADGGDGPPDEPEPGTGRRFDRA